MKASVEQIRERFDRDVERFSNLETGQSATIDAPLALDLIAAASAAVTPRARALLDVGCGAGNYTLRLIQKLPDLGRAAAQITLLDLSRPMLDRALERVGKASQAKLIALQTDIREAALDAESFDLIVAAAVLHHLREEAEWRAVFAKFYRTLKPGGSLWISDLIAHSLAPVQSLMWRRYGNYLAQLKDEAYRDHVFDYIEREDTPRPLLFQLDLLRDAGFRQVEILHKNNCFAAFGGVK